ncbi:hypothetical protein PSE10B_50610 [Pseudomonas amygdali pv. eriobotryae]|uniref:DUF4123 domain-containing protein n=1 Tax=Pseudomonas amygdali TaxID=47877 RepID=UPI0006B911C9|nr:DUF4123 domain-containing protein [Pseudomonas amygdali]KPB67612.1 Uncharacterized protein AC510_3698 [Pseudomonas amygdali pv. myricae]KPX90986.1 Uncharacterized protein ALO62_02413 [Pseudomonas amygdali pv. myricae]KWS50004.1 hypothetical protein AL057_24440 [Pseudomonas amygdali pv. myricae]RMU93994.1 hypothetical protein ALP18_02010 [Pseudomonas amygdali pv. myricae]RMV31766.1 hypothetical protein ALP14_01363 [Pseudomonas amygdali pv. myricae]
MKVYVLLERTDSLLEQLYQRLPDPAPAVLFDKTELAAYREKSPLFLDTSGSNTLVEAMHEEPESWPGLIIESPSPADVLLGHLRHILFVRFDGQRRGVLRYSHPVTASYFFTAEPPQSSAQWFGPISRLGWYGGTWEDLAQGKQRWFDVRNPHAPDWQPPQPQVTFGLNQWQEDALRRQNKEFLQ